MSQVTRSGFEPLHAAAFGWPVSEAEMGASGGTSRTEPGQYLLDTILPAAALLTMSVLTVALIVLIVTAVAHGGWLSPGTYVSVDPWANVHPGAALLREDDILYPDVATGQGPQQRDPSFDADAWSAPDAGYVAAQLGD